MASFVFDFSGLLLSFPSGLVLASMVFVFSCLGFSCPRRLVSAEVVAVAANQGLDTTEVQQEFQELDTNGNGRLDAEELAAAATGAGAFFRLLGNLRL